MWLKNTGSKLPPSGAKPTFSITVRLTLLYSLSAFGTLVVATGFLYYALVSNLGQEDNRFIADKINDLRTILRERPGDLSALEEEINQGTDFPFINYARVLDSRGRTIIEFPAKNTLPVSFFPNPITADLEPAGGEKKRGPDGKLYLRMAAWARTGTEGSEKMLLQAALDVSLEEEIIHNYQRKVLLVLVIGIFFSAALGIFITRRGMRPLGEITRVVQRIRATQLSDRVNPSQWPRELTALATSFDEMLTRLEDSFSRLARFSSDLAHELRTPINNLMGEAEVALAKSRTAEEYQQILESSLEEYARLSHMIESLLFLARAENTDIRIEQTAFDPIKEITAVLEYYDALIEETKINISCRGSAVLQADSLLFRRVISNILSNALCYTPPGGRIDIEVRESDGKNVTVSISDSGIGIQPEDLSKIFDRFYRSGSAQALAPKGTGLGLAIVKSIMDLHGGSVAIKSGTAEGTTVHLTFPSYPASFLP